MNDEGYVKIDSRRFGPLAFLRRKQWWYFEGLDPEQGLYFVFLALQAIPSDYVSLKVIDYRSNRRWTKDYLGSFRSAPGDAVDVLAEGKWGRMHFQGCAEEGWQVEVDSPQLKARVRQIPRAPRHKDWLLTQHIDYTITQFVMNHAGGQIQFEGQDVSFSGYGYHEHNWGVQPRHSTAHWLHFWCPDTAGVVLNCYYDHGVPHHYTYLWHEGGEYKMYSPAHFTFDPRSPQDPWRVHSPDLELSIRPLAAHHSRMQIPPLLAYIDIDYYEQLLEVEGYALVEGQRIPIAGLGKLDHNWNRW
jgi:hypothetical protein